jgi:hypothetical protein
MHPPIIAYNFGDTLIFRSTQAAERYVEPIDVQNGEYVFYDSTGALVVATITFRQKVVLSLSEPAVDRADELQIILRNHLAILGEPAAWLEQASLEALVAQCLHYTTD